MASDLRVSGCKSSKNLLSNITITAFIQPCKTLEAAINDRKKTYIEKVSALVNVLGNILSCNLSQTTNEQILLLFEFLHRHTLHLVLHGDWGKNKPIKGHVEFLLKRFESAVAVRRSLPALLSSVQYLVKLLSEPWGHATLEKIFSTKDCTKEEGLQLIKAEMGLVLIVRLEVLVEARCDDQALWVINVCLRCIRDPEMSAYFDAYQEEITHIQDIYFILLVKTKDTTTLCDEMKKMGLLGWLNMIRRFSKEEMLPRLRRARINTLNFAAQFSMTHAMMQSISDEAVLLDLIDTFYNLYPDTKVISRLLKKIMMTAQSSQHIYIMGQVLVKKFGAVDRPLCIELYIRALTVNLNEVEKYKNNNEQENIKLSEQQLHQGFLELADYLEEDVLTCRECVLSAFSIDPTRSCYSRLKELAIASGKLSRSVTNDGHDNCENSQSSINCEKRPTECQLPPMKIDTGQLAESDQCNNTLLVTKSDMNQQPKDSSSTLYIPDSKVLGISQTLCDDLATVISSARYQVLSWNLDWQELSTRCESYITVGKELRSSEKELKFLNIDYNQFKDWPSRDDENETGIEKGFEHFVESEEDQPSFSNTEEEDVEKTSKPKSAHQLVQESKPKDSVLTKASNKYSLIKTDAAKKSASLSQPSKSSSIKTNTVKKSASSSQPCKKKSKHKNEKPKKSKSFSKEKFDQDSLRPQLVKFIETNDLIDIASIEEDAKTSTNTPPLLPNMSLSWNHDIMEMSKSHKTLKECQVDTGDSSNANKQMSLKEQILSVPKKMSYQLDYHELVKEEYLLNAKKELQRKQRERERNENSLLRKSQGPHYCIAENDPSLSTSLSTYQSPSKMSDPNVMKTLRNFRTKKPSVLESLPQKDHQPNDIRDKFKPMMSTVDLHPRILSRSKPVKPDVIQIDVDSESDVIVLSDDSNEEEDNNKKKTTIPKPKPTAFHVVREKIRSNFENHMNTLKSYTNKMGPVSKGNPMNDSLARTLGLKSVDMIRPPVSDTIVNMVQATSSSRPLVTSNNNTIPISSVIFTMSQQTVQTTQGQTTASNMPTDTTVTFTSSQQPSSMSAGAFSQVSNSNVTANTTVIYSGPQASALAQMRTSETVTKSNVTTRVITAVSSQSIVNTVPSTSYSIVGLSGRNLLTASSRQAFSHTSGAFVPRQSIDTGIQNPPIITTTTISRRRTSSPRDLLRTPVLQVSESNPQVPNLSPIKAPVSAQTHSSLNRQLSMRGGMIRTTAQATAQSFSIVTTNKQSSSLPSTTGSTSAQVGAKGMNVIQRVGYPPETTSTQTNQVSPPKFLFKDGVLTPINSKGEIIPDSPNIPCTEEIQQAILKNVAQNEKQKSNKDDSRLTQGASLPKFQQAFGRSIYQNTSTASTSGVVSNETNQLNFTQQLNPTNVSSDPTNSPICTVLSKAVQTSSKSSDASSDTQSDTGYSSAQSNSSNMKMCSGTSSTTVQTVAVSTSTSQTDTPTSKYGSLERSSLTQTSPVKIFCKVPAGSNLLQGKSVAFLKTPEKSTLNQGKVECTMKEKSSIISNNMNAIIAAALSGQSSMTKVTSSSSAFQTATVLKSSVLDDKRKIDQNPASNKGLTTKTYRKTPVQQPVMRYTKPLLQVATGTAENSTTSTPVVTIPIRTVLATSHATTPTQLSVNRVEIRSDTSSLQDDLKEFDDVLNKIKKTSQMKERTTNPTSVPIQPQSNLSHQILLSQSSDSAGGEFSNSSSNQTTLYQSTSTSTINDLPGERINLTLITHSTSGVTNSIMASSSQKITSATPVVVVQSCSKPVSSPALSVTSQNSLSPAPSSTPGSSKMAASSAGKQNKSNKTKTATKTAPTTTLKVSTLPKPQQKPQEDEQTTQRIYAILDQYAEQLRNSPELKNKPAPRRRSNPPTNPNQNSKRKKTTQTKSKLPSQQTSCSGIEMSPGSEDMRTIGSEDSSNGVSQLSQTLNSPQSRQEDPSTPTGGDVSSETSESLDSRDTRIQSRVVLTETGQSRTVIVQDNSLPTQVLNVETSKLLTGKPMVVGSQTLVPQLVLPNVAGVQKMFFPVNTEGRQVVVAKKMYKVHQVTLPKGSTSFLGPGAVVVRQMCGSTGSVKQVKLPVMSTLSSQNLNNVIPSTSQSFTLSHEGTLESSDALNINLDNAILLNSSPSQSISFLHRNVPTSTYQTEESSTSATTNSSATTTSNLKPSIAYTTSDMNVSFSKQESNSSSICSSTNTVPVSTQDVKPEARPNMTCISLDEEMEFSSSDQRTSGVTALVIAQSTQSRSSRNTDHCSWRSREDSARRETLQNNDELGEFPTLKSIMANRPAKSSLVNKHHPLTKCQKDVDNIERDNDSEPEKDKPEHVLQEPDLCEDTAESSSDSGGSGRVKRRDRRSSQDTPPWQYNVTKIDCIKPSNPSTIMKETETENQPLALSHHPQGASYKKKTNNVENNTIYQMAFRRSDRNKTVSKEHDRNSAALERDLKFQKSLSEECEDLGVEEPLPSELFPGAELLLDPDQSSRDSQLTTPADISSSTIEGSMSQVMNPSLSSDLRALSPIFAHQQKKPVTYRSNRSQTINKNGRSLAVFNFQYNEESQNANKVSGLTDSPEASHSSKVNKSNSSSELDTSYRSLVSYEELVEMSEKQLSVSDISQLNQSSSSRNSSEQRSIINVSSDSQCTSDKRDSLEKSSDKTSDSSVILMSEKKNVNQVIGMPMELDANVIDLDTTTDSDSIIESENKPSMTQEHIDDLFVPMPNPAANAPLTYNRKPLSSGNKKPNNSGSKKHKSSDKVSGASKNNSKYISVGKNLEGSHLSEAVLSLHTSSNLAITSSSEAVLNLDTSTNLSVTSSEGETKAKNGLESDPNDSLLNSERSTRSSKKGKKRPRSVPTTSNSSRSKLSRIESSSSISSTEEFSLGIQPRCVSSPICKNAALHFDASGRRSSLRGHIKKNCQCCNGSQEKTLQHKTNLKTESKATSPDKPTTSANVTGKKDLKQNKNPKSSHINKKKR